MCHFLNCARFIRERYFKSFLILTFAVLTCCLFQIDGQAQISKGFANKKLEEAYQKSLRTKHLWSFGFEMGYGAPAFTTQFLLKGGNEKYGYLSYGLRSVSRTTLGVSLRYDKSFELFGKGTSSSIFQPCIIAAMNFYYTSYQRPFELFSNAETVYQVGKHRSFSIGPGFDLGSFKGTRRAGIRIGFLYSHVIDEFDVFRESGDWNSSFKDRIIRRAHMPFQVTLNFNLMFGKPDYNNKLEEPF